MSDLKDLQKKAMRVANHYDEYNREVGRKGWDLQDYVDGLVGDVGDLTKASMGLHGRRDINDAEVKFEHELNDIMWSVLMLYYFLRVDPDKSFIEAMELLENRIIAMKQDIKSKAT